MSKSRFSLRSNTAVLLATAPVLFAFGANYAYADDAPASEATPNSTQLAKKAPGVPVYEKSYEILKSPDIDKVPARFLTHIKNTQRVFNIVLSDQYLAQADIFNVDQAKVFEDEGRRNRVSSQQVAIELSAMFLDSALTENKSIFDTVLSENRDYFSTTSKSLEDLGVASAEIILNPSITDDRLRLKAADTLEIVTRLKAWAILGYANSDGWGMDMPKGSQKEIQDEIIQRAKHCTISWAMPGFNYAKRVEMAHATCHNLDLLPNVEDYITILKNDGSSIPLIRAYFLEQAESRLNQSNLSLKAME